MARRGKELETIEIVARLMVYHSIAHSGDPPASKKIAAAMEEVLKVSEQSTARTLRDLQSAGILYKQRAPFGQKLTLDLNKAWAKRGEYNIGVQKKRLEESCLPDWFRTEIIDLYTYLFDTVDRKEFQYFEDLLYRTTISENEIKRLIEIEVKRKCLIPTTEIAEEQAEQEKSEKMPGEQVEKEEFLHNYVNVRGHGFVSDQVVVDYLMNTLTGRVREYTRIWKVEQKKID